MRFQLAAGCNDLSHDSPNDPGRSGLAWKGNYAPRGRTLTRAYMRGRGVQRRVGRAGRASAERTMPTCWCGAEGPSESLPRRRVDGRDSRHEAYSRPGSLQKVRAQSERYVCG